MGLSRQEVWRILRGKTYYKPIKPCFWVGGNSPPPFLGLSYLPTCAGIMALFLEWRKKREILISGDDWKCIFYYCISPHYRTPASSQDFKYSRPCFVYSFRHYLFSKPMVFLKKKSCLMMHLHFRLHSEPRKKTRLDYWLNRRPRPQTKNPFFSLLFFREKRQHEKKGGRVLLR